MVGYGDSATWPRTRINQHFDPRDDDQPEQPDELAESDPSDEGECDEA